MFKKFLSSIAVLAVLAVSVPVQVLADNFENEDLVNVVITAEYINPVSSDVFIADGNSNYFDPSLEGANLKIDPTFDYDGNNSLGIITILNSTENDDAEGFVLDSWIGNEASDDVRNWDGTGCDDANLDLLCPDGEYRAKVFLAYGEDNDNFTDVDFIPFKIDTLHLDTFTISDDDNADLNINGTKFKPETETFSVAYNFDQDLDALSIVVKDSNNAIVHTFENLDLTAGNQTTTWDGKKADGSNADTGVYTAVITSTKADHGTIIESKTFNIEAPAPVPDPDFALSTFTLSTANDADATLATAKFDPSDSGDNEDLTFTYNVNQVADSLSIVIKNSKDVEVKNFSHSNLALGDHADDIWDGEAANKIVPAGTYTATLTAKKSGETDITESKTFIVAYDHAQKPVITFSKTIVSANAARTSGSVLDPNNEEVKINFSIANSDTVTIDVRNIDGDVVRTFADFTDKVINSNVNTDFTWDGKSSSNSYLADDTYIIFLTARSVYGVHEVSTSVRIDRSSNTFQTSNTHIKNISCKPSGDFEPADEDLVCEADTKIDDLDVQVFAVHGSERIELFDDGNVDEGSDSIEFTWNGQDDDDEYVSPGVWTILFESRADGSSTVLKSAVTRKIKYEEPSIDEFFFSKDEIDTDLGEFTYAIFKIDEDARVDLNYFLDNDLDDEILEEVDVEKDKWYAFEIDGNSYDHGDDVDVELVAMNKVQDDVKDSKKLSLDVKEDDVSSSKSNITNDAIYPVVTSCDEEMEIVYELEKDADVTVTIYKGKNGSGTKVIELVNEDDQESGNHSVTWNCRNDKEKKLSDGFYSYKIQSKTSSTEAEVGIFVVADDDEIGDVDGRSGGSSSNNSSLPVQVIPANGNPSPSLCAGFSDVTSTDPKCKAIEWNKSKNIFVGYPDGSFGLNTTITRTELLKVILEAYKIDSSAPANGNLGFIDVDTGAWYMRFIRKGQELGVFQGDGSRPTARPNDAVSRVEVLKMVFETLKIANNHQMSTCSDPYTDTNMNEWYGVYICEAKKFNLFEVYNNAFMPSKYATRGEVAELLYKLEEAGAF